MHGAEPASDPMSHTPGPWAVVHRGSTVLNDKAFDYPDTVRHTYVDEQGRRCTAFVATCDSTTLPNADNARLIAAAPEMYEALKAVRMFIHNGIELGFIRMPDWMTNDTASLVPAKVDAVIAKAEGRQ